MSDPVVTRGHYALLSIASATTYLLLVMGGVICVTGSGLGCPDWPMCYGRIIPPVDMGAIIETTHRFLAAVTSPLIVAAAVLGWRRHHSTWWLSRPSMAAVVLVLAVVVFGAFAVLTGLPPVVAAIDVGSALMVLALVLTTWTVAHTRRGDPSLPDRLVLGGSFAKLAFAASTAVFLVLASGPLVADTGSIARCVGWPLYGAVAGAAEVGGALPGVRRALGATAAVLIVSVVIQAWRVYRGSAAILCWATILTIMFAGEAVLGALMLFHGFTMLFGVLYVAAAVGVWAMLIVLTALAAMVPDEFAA
jgi:heme A synthase